VEFNEDVADRNQDGVTGQMKTQENWVVEIGWLMPRIKVDGEICLRRPRPTQDCKANDDNDNDEGYEDVEWTHLAQSSVK
jgi:hypothetical protein